MADSSKRRDITYVPLISVSNGLEHLKENKRWKWTSFVFIFWIITLILCGFLYSINIFELKFLISFNGITDLSKSPVSPQIYSSLHGYLINTPGCRIPEMDPFDFSIRKFIFKPKKLLCAEELPPLFESNLSSIFMVTENLPYYNVSNSSDLNCCYEEFWRQTPKAGSHDNQIKYGDICKVLNSTAVRIDEEFIKLICKAQGDRKVYEEYFPFVPMKKREQETSARSNSVKPNILILGLDAVSRQNLHRQLPKTYTFLMEKLEAIELLGYNKVGDNTFPNLIPVLTGMFESELQASCWPSLDSHFDNCSFIWNNFSHHNYVTAFGEDCAWMGLFNYQRRGFTKQPTDYYFSSFSREAEANTGRKKDFNCNHCVGGRETYKVLLNYIEKYIGRMKLESHPYFGFFWSSSLSHDYLNRPNLGDDTYNEFLNNLLLNGHLENTVFILMSDHGIRWGDIRQTYQGQLEERLPFVFMVLPKLLKENYPTAVANLKRNIRRLTTPFDLHETLNNLLNFTNFGTHTEQSRNGEAMPRGFSLFTEIPIARTCEYAAIDSHWCTCQKSNEVMTNDTQVISAAKFAVDNINTKLEGYAQCAPLVLDNILNARVMYYSSEHINDKQSIKDYTITLKTMPGEGVFEVTVRNKENQQHMLTTRNKKRSLIAGLEGKDLFRVRLDHIARSNENGLWCIRGFVKEQVSKIPPATKKDTNIRLKHCLLVC